MHYAIAGGSAVTVYEAVVTSENVATVPAEVGAYLAGVEFAYQSTTPAKPLVMSGDDLL
jgi:hypothetical protein